MSDPELDQWSDPPDLGSESDNTDSTLVSLSTGARKRQRAPSAQDDLIPNKKNISPSTSTQHFYIVPQFDVKDLHYDQTDLGPYVVHLTKNIADPASGYTLRVLKVAQLLFKNKVTGICSDGIKLIGRNKVALQFKTWDEANKFLECEFLSAYDFHAQIPTYNVTRTGIIKGIPVDWSMEELVNALECPSGCGPVLKARRLNRKTFIENKPVWIPTQTVAVTFKSTFLPKKIFCFNAAINVDKYQLPSIQCLSCCRFGHTQNFCRSKPRCFKCAQPHSGSTCQVIDSSCLFCSGNHFATDKVCPEHNRQKIIKNIVSEESISYMEASARVPSINRRLYADIVKFTPSPPSPIIEKAQTQSAPVSYKKTVSVPRSCPASVCKSYDKVAHNAIIASPSSTMTNGCALNSERSSQNENLLELISCTLLNMISKFDEMPLPNNILQILQKISYVVNSQHGSDSTMECEERHIKEM